MKVAKSQIPVAWEVEFPARSGIVFAATRAEAGLTMMRTARGAGVAAPKWGAVRRRKELDDWPGWPGIVYSTEQVATPGAGKKFHEQVQIAVMADGPRALVAAYLRATAAALEGGATAGSTSPQNKVRGRFIVRP